MQSYGMHKILLATTNRKPNWKSPELLEVTSPSKGQHRAKQYDSSSPLRTKNAPYSLTKNIYAPWWSQLLKLDIILNLLFSYV